MPSALINKLRRWAPIPDDAIDLLRNIKGRRIALRRGDHPLAALNQDDTALFLLDGWASQYKDTTTGKHVIVDVMLPGDVQMPTIHRDSSIETIMLSEGTALLVPLGAVHALAENQAIRESLEWIEKVRESIHLEWIVNISSRHALPRLAHLLCELSARMNSVGLCLGNDCEMPLTQIELANALSMTNVHLNIALQKLRILRLVRISAKRLKILDRAKLEEVADFDDAYLLRWPVRHSDRRHCQVNAFAPAERRV